MKKKLPHIILFAISIAIFFETSPASTVFKHVKIVAAYDQGKEKIKQLKVAFISKELQLNKEEYGRFWILYSNYEESLQQAWLHAKNDKSLFDDKSKEIRRNYMQGFKKVLGSEERAHKVYELEVKFREILQKELNNRK